MRDHIRLEKWANIYYNLETMKKLSPNSTNIWQELAAHKKPFFVLAPMDDVTDTVLRQMVQKHAPADIMMTEFANADGWCSPGREAIATRLKHLPIERPLIAQIWGITPEHYKQMANDIVELGFDGVDINMGCPVKDMIKRGACSALIENHALAAEIIAATREGVGGKIPVSVKTRIGFNNIQTDDWIGFLLQQKLDAILVHGRTKRDMSKVPANWDEITKAVKLRDGISPSTIIVGNGDVMSLAEGRERAKQSGVDGVMIGRGLFQNFFVFAHKQPDKDLPMMLRILREHVVLHQNTWQEAKFEPLKKFVKMYVNGFEHASDTRNTLMLTKSHQELLLEIDKMLKSS